MSEERTHERQNRFYGRTAKEWAIDQEKWHSLKNERTYSKHFE